MEPHVNRVNIEGIFSKVNIEGTFSKVNIEGIFPTLTQRVYFLIFVLQLDS